MSFRIKDKSKTMEKAYVRRTLRNCTKNKWETDFKSIVFLKFSQWLYKSWNELIWFKIANKRGVNVSEVRVWLLK